MIHERNLALMFKVLAVTPRVRIIQLLKQRPLCVGALSVRLDITPGAVSQHLQVLRKAGLVKAEKRGYFMHYQLNQETLSQWKELADEFLTVSEAPVARDFHQAAGGPDNMVKPK